VRILHKNKRGNWILAIAGLFIVSFVAYLLYHSQIPVAPATQNSPDNNQSDGRQVEQANQESSNPNEANSAIPEASENRDIITTPKPNINLSIDAIERDARSIFVTTTITPQSSGKCILEMTRPDFQKISAETRLVNSTPNTSSCEKLSLPADKIANGQWTVTVKVITDNAVATSTKSFTMN
jgi:hypothetical protein